MQARFVSKFHLYRFLMVLMHLLDPSCLLLPPHRAVRFAPNQINSIAAALATRFNVSIATVRPYLDDATVEEWGKLRRIDSDAGDTMWASSCCAIRDLVEWAIAAHGMYESHWFNWLLCKIRK